MIPVGPALVFACLVPRSHGRIKARKRLWMERWVGRGLVKASPGAYKPSSITKAASLRYHSISRVSIPGDFCSFLTPSAPTLALPSLKCNAWLVQLACSAHGPHLLPAKIYKKKRGNYHIQKGINRAASQIHDENSPMHFEYPDSIQLLLMKPEYLVL